MTTYHRETDRIERVTVEPEVGRGEIQSEDANGDVWKYGVR